MNARSLNSRLLLASLAASGIGCARDRDFAVVEPNLARPYQTGTVVANGPAVVGVQPVAGRKGVALPVHQTQPVNQPAVLAGGPQATVALPPQSSTAAMQPGVPAPPPYYSPAPIGQSSLPTAHVAAGPSFVGGAPVSQPVIGAGVYPAAPTGMWMPTNGNQPIAVHQFPTHTTGSSFTPSVPVAAANAPGLIHSIGVVHAGAMVPYESGIPANAPPPTSSRQPFLSETGETQRSSQIPPSPVANPPPELLGSSPPLDRRDVPAAPGEQPPPSQPKSIAMPPPVDSLDDIQPKTKTPRKAGEVMDAESADPSRIGPSKIGGAGKSPGATPLPKVDQGGNDRNPRPAPKKTPEAPKKQKSGKEPPAPDSLLPEDDLPLPKAAGSGS